MISTEIMRVKFTGDGKTKKFPFPFKLDNSTDMAVYTLKDGLLTRVNDFYVTPNDGEFPTTGGTVTYPAADDGLAIDSDTVIYLMRDVPFLQLYKFARTNNLSLEDVEDAFDTLVEMIQQIKDKADRSVLVDFTETDTSGFNLPTPEEGKVLVWKSNHLANKDVSDHVTTAQLEAYVRQVIEAIPDLESESF